MMITHNEAVSIAEYLTVGRYGTDPNDASGGDNSFAVRPVYLPTVYYTYHPCDAAIISVDEMIEVCRP